MYLQADRSRRYMDEHPERPENNTAIPDAGPRLEDDVVDDMVEPSTASHSDSSMAAEELLATDEAFARALQAEFEEVSTISVPEEFACHFTIYHSETHFSFDL